MADATAADVRTMKLDDAKRIYRTKYWDALRCDALPAGLDYTIFDYGVNSGIVRAAKVLQRTLGMRISGVIGDAEVDAARRHFTSDLIGRICDERLAFLKSLKTWPVFGSGWGRRVAEVRSAALAMTKAKKAEASPIAPTASPGAIARLLNWLFGKLRITP